MGDTHITGRHFGGDTHITSDMCAGIHISRGYTYHCDTPTTLIRFRMNSHTFNAFSPIRSSTLKRPDILVKKEVFENCFKSGAVLRV